MSDPIPLSALKTPGVSTVSAIGSDGAGGAKLLSAEELRSAAAAYSASQVDAALALRVPYSGANAAVNLGSQSLSAGAITASGTVSIGTGSRLVDTGTQLITQVSATNSFAVSSSFTQVRSTNWIGFASTSNAQDAGDCRWFRGGSGIIQQRNGLNPQTYELFSTYTSTTSFQSLCLKATSTAFQIGSARGTSDANLPVQLGHFSSAGVFTRSLDVLANGSVRVGTDANEYIEFDAGSISVIRCNSNALGMHYLLIGDSTGGGGPMIFRIGAQGTLEWQSTNRADAGTSDIAIGRASAGVLGIYTNNSRATLANLACSAINASGNLNLTALPTSDPGVAGRVWRDGTNLRISV